MSLRLDSYLIKRQHAADEDCKEACDVKKKKHSSVETRWQFWRRLNFQSFDGRVNNFHPFLISSFFMTWEIQSSSQGRGRAVGAVAKEAALDKQTCLNN